MEAKKDPPKDLLLIKEGVEDVILPAIREGSYFEAKNTLRNILGVIDHSRIRIEHCGMSLLASLQVLSDILEEQQYDSIEGAQEQLRAFLAQSLMYY